MGVVIGARLLCGGCLLGIFMGLLVGCVLGGPTAFFTYLSIKDAVRHGATKSFSLDNCTSAHDSCIDVPPSVLSAEIADDWPPASHYIWSLFYTSLSVGVAVGLGACNAQSCLLHICNSEVGERRVARSTPSRPNTLSPLLCRVWIGCDDCCEALRACAHAACVHHETGGRYSVALLGNAMILTDTRAGLQ